MNNDELERFVSSLDLGGSTKIENLQKYLKLSESEQAKVWSKNSEISSFKILKAQVAAVSNSLPLDKIRDDENGPFDNYMCSGCGKGTTHVEPIIAWKTCSRCKSVKYCSKLCQQLDWIGKGESIMSSRSYKHKDNCAQFSSINEEFRTHSTAGNCLRTTLFPSWADQHHENGSFFMHEFLVRRKVLGGEEVGFWAMQDCLHQGPYQKAGKDLHGFINGQMLLNETFPSLAEGWTSSLKHNEFPSSDPPLNSLPKEGLKSWEDYMNYRNLASTSIAPLLLTYVLTVYQMIYHELKLPQKKDKLCVYLLAVEVELNQIPLFRELLYLLPNGTDLELILQSSAAKAIHKEAKSFGKHCILNHNDYVLDAVDKVGKRRVRIKIEGEYEYFHDNLDVSHIPDAVIGLNAGLGAYTTWSRTLLKLFDLNIPFCFSDQTEMNHTIVERTTLPKLTKLVKKKFGLILTAPCLQISLNPFHGIVGRDVAAELVPNLSNGYLMTCLSL